MESNTNTTHQMNEEEDTTLEDWHALCRGEAEFDSYHFFTLFMERSIEEVKGALAYFPKGEEMAKKVMHRLGLLRREVDAAERTPPWLVEQTKQYVKKVIELFEQHGEAELASKLRDVEVEYHPDGNYVSQHYSGAEFDDDVFQAIGDIVGRNFWEGEKYDCLEEAFYGITTDYQMAWYLASPLITVDPGSKYYYKVARIGGVIAFVPGKCYVGLRTFASQRYL